MSRAGERGRDRFCASQYDSIFQTAVVRAMEGREVPHPGIAACLREFEREDGLSSPRVGDAAGCHTNRRPPRGCSISPILFRSCIEGASLHRCMNRGGPIIVGQTSVVSASHASAAQLPTPIGSAPCVRRPAFRRGGRMPLGRWTEGDWQSLPGRRTLARDGSVLP